VSPSRRAAGQLAYLTACVRQANSGMRGARERRRGIALAVVAPMRPILRLTAAMLTLALAVQGCALFARHYPNPPLPLQPTTVGVIAETTQDASGYHAHLVDGRVIDLPQNGTFKLIGGGLEDKGTLLLAGTAGGGF